MLTYPGSVMQFEGQDFSGKATKQTAMNWISAPKRERKTKGYSVSKYFQEVMSGGSQPKVAKVAPVVIFALVHQA